MGGELPVGLVDHDQASVAASNFAISSSDSARPVGLFGEHTKVRTGWARSTSSMASAPSMVKSAHRPPETTVVPVTRAMWLWRAYVGSKVAADRPGPP